MRFKFALSLVLAAVVTSGALAQRPEVRIETPKQGAVVDARQPVTGIVGDKSAQVWVIIHPRATPDYWVQPEVAVDRETGTWRTLGCFGEEGQHHGARYDMAAVVNPSFQLRGGMVLSGWPRCQAMSPVILVTRQ